MSGRSWFYLTLFNGSPANATEYVDVDITEREIVGTEVETTDALSSDVDLLDAYDAQISRADTFGVDIILTTEVIWRVN